VPSLAYKEIYFANPDNYYLAGTHLDEFNPNLVYIATSQIPANLNDDGILYLASFRVATHHACMAQFLSSIDFKRRPKRPKSYLGLAPLRTDLSIVADVVADDSATPRFPRLCSPNSGIMRDRVPL
jgi:hypothetical protein